MPMTPTPYVYRNPPNGHWITGTYRSGSDFMQVPLRELTELLPYSYADGAADVPVTVRTVNLERHTLYRSNVHGGPETRLEVFAEDTATAMAWALGRLEELSESAFNDAYYNGNEPHQTQQMTPPAPPFNLERLLEASRMLDAADVPRHDRMVYGHQFLDGSIQYVPQLPAETEDDVVERSAGAVDDHVYDAGAVDLKEKTTQTWDEWMASSAQVLEDAADRRKGPNEQ